MNTPRELFVKELWQELHERYPETYPPVTAEEAKEIAAGQIRARYARLMATLVQPYSQAERETWFTQLKEADDWLTDDTVPTPLLSAIAAARGVTVEVMVGKVKESDNLFRATVGHYLGMQQAELDALYAID